MQKLSTMIAEDCATHRARIVELEAVVASLRGELRRRPRARRAYDTEELRIIVEEGCAAFEELLIEAYRRGRAEVREIAKSAVETALTDFDARCGDTLVMKAAAAMSSLSNPENP